jgi:hypothetical protein
MFLLTFVSQPTKYAILNTLYSLLCWLIYYMSELQVHGNIKQWNFFFVAGFSVKIYIFVLHISQIQPKNEILKVNCHTYITVFCFCCHSQNNMTQDYFLE